MQKVVITPPAASAGAPATSSAHLFTVRVGNTTAVGNARDPDRGTLNRRQAWHEGAGRACCALPHAVQRRKLLPRQTAVSSPAVHSLPSASPVNDLVG